MSVSDSLGMTPKTAVVVLDELFKMRTEIEKKMEELDKRSPSRASAEYLALQQQHADVEKKLDRAMSWYSVHLLESSVHVLEDLKGETRTLKRLTKGLIGLTVVLVGLTVILAVLTWILVTKLP